MHVLKRKKDLNRTVDMDNSYSPKSFQDL